MQLRLLEYFLVVAREENITRAAEVLHVTQPTLSRQMNELEEEFGTQLFIRGKRRTLLTEAGLMLRRRAQQMTELSEIAHQEIGSMDRQVSGTVRIGAAEGAGAAAFPEVMRDFCQQYPSVRFQFVSGNADQTKEQMERGLIDIGLLIESVNLEGYEFIRLPMPERWGILLRQDDPLSKKDFITDDDLRDHRIITSKRVDGDGPQHLWCGDWFKDINVLATYNLIGNAAMLARHGLGYVVSIEGAACHYDQNELCFRPFFPEIASTYVLVWQRSQMRSSAVEEFIKALKIHFRHDK